ncbi:MAG: site-specific integrase [Methanosarcina sp.]
MATITKRTNPNGETCYQARVRLKGHPVQTETFKRLTDAKKWGVQIEAAIRERRHFKTVESTRHTLAELIDRYIRDVIPRKARQGKMQKPQLEYWRSEIGAYLLADVTPAMIAEVRDKLLRTTTNRGGLMNGATVNRYLAALSHAFSVALKEWGWIEDNPCRKVTKPKEPRGRVRFLSDDERNRLLSACRESKQPHLLPVVVLALSTGMRAQEILGLTWDRVDIKQGRVLLEHTKNGERRLVPLVGQARAILEAHREATQSEEEDFLFPGRKSKPVDLRCSFLLALARAEIEDFRFHDLRHSAASYLAMNGASVAEIAEVLGHKTLQMVKRYAHLSEAHTTGVVERMNTAIFGGMAID